MPHGQSAFRVDTPRFFERVYKLISGTDRKTRDLVEFPLEPRKRTRSSQYFVFTDYELLSLVICILLDVSEYMLVILLFPLVGDFLDVVGIIMCFALFRWIGLISLLELVPGVDVLPIYIITWLIWYLVRRRKTYDYQQHNL